MKFKVTFRGELTATIEANNKAEAMEYAWTEVNEAEHFALWEVGSVDLEPMESEPT